MAMPTEPPRLRMMLKMAEPLACSRSGSDPAESADNGVIMKGCPAARTSCDQRNCWMPQSCVRNEFIKQLMAKHDHPKGDHQARVHPSHHKQHERKDRELRQAHPHHDLADL